MPTALVSVLAVFLVERVDIHDAFADQVIVHHHHAEDRPHRGADAADERGRASLPRRKWIQHERDERRDVSASFEGDPLRKHIRKVERGRDEVGHDVDAERRDGERQRRQQRQEPAVELRRNLIGVQQHFAVHGESGGGGHAGNESEEDEIDGQAPDVALTHGRFVARVAGEIAEIEVQRREISDPGRRDRSQRGDGAGLAGDARILGLFEQHVPRNPAAEGEASRLYEKVDGENKHHDPDRGSRPILEPAHRFHAALDDQELQRPNDHEADHFQPRMAEKVSALVERHDAFRACEQRHDGTRRGGRLRAVPKAGHDRAHQRGHVRTPDAERRARQHRIRDAGSHARVSHEVHQKENDQRPEADGDNEVQEVAAEQEQARGKVVPPQAVDVGRPDVEDAEGSPLAFGCRCEVFVVKRRRGVWNGHVVSPG